MTINHYFYFKHKGVVYSFGVEMGGDALSLQPECPQWSASPIERKIENCIFPRYHKNMLQVATSPKSALRDHEFGFVTLI